MKYYNTNIEEQETQINIDYYSKKLNIYSSRKSIIERLYKMLGEPTKIHYINKSITSACWIISFSDKKRMSKALSKPILIGQMK